jgi:hypothetical protein
MRSALLALPFFLSLPAGASRAGDEPSLEDLLRLNGEAIFGGPARLEAGDRIVIPLTKPGQFEKCFVNVGKSAMVNPESLKGDLNRKILANPNPEAGGEVPNPVIVGKGDGDWQSKFELSGDVEVRFNLRVPALQNGSRLQLRLNQSSKGMLQTGSFFQGAALVSGKKAVKQAQPPKEYQGPPDKWFEKKEIVGIEAVFAKGNFTLKMRKNAKDPKDVVEAELAKIEDAAPAGGKIAFSYNKLTFLISDLTIAGKIDREWIKGQLEELKSKGKLVEKEPPKEAEPPPLRQPKKEAPADGKKEEEEDL